MVVKYLILASLLLLTISPPSVCAQTAAEHYNRGVDLAKIQDWRRAIDEFTKAIAIDPDLASAFHNRGIAYHGLKWYDLARADLDRAIQLNPNNSGSYTVRAYIRLDSVGWNIYRGEFDLAYGDLQAALRIDPSNRVARDAILRADVVRLNMRAETEINKGNFAEAIRLFNEALGKQPNDLDTLFARGRAYLLDSKYALSIADYDAYIARKADDAGAFSNRGLAKCELGKIDEAISDQTTAIALKPSWVADAYVRRGRAHREKKDLINASVDFDNALRVDPNSVFALINKALVYSERKIFDLAIVNASKAISLKPNDAELYLARGDIYKASADNAKALADYDQAAKLEPTSPAPYRRKIGIYKEAKAVAELEAEYDRFVAALPAEGLNARGHYYYFAKNYPKALADFHEWNRLDPKGVAALQMLAYAYERIGDPREALKYTDQVIKLRPSSFDHTFRASILFKLKKFYDASIAIEQAIKLDPKDFYPLTWRGRLRAEQGDLAGALEDYGRSLELYGRSSETYLFRGLMYAKMGKKAEAIADVKRALELDPDNAEARSELAKLTKPRSARPTRKR